ncbi:Vacuolar protein sorting-associated protein 70 [Linderina macrospora]|uniref:Vacuolar protein sorting-associated protein 70 n=1 Tax=Linderina macrospora TaxID=4868 RepID=A0ACC1JHG3_9FUNG|nr:Vacuolar protein sorting-associated protein 70 [Linderina macrospora]
MQSQLLPLSDMPEKLPLLPHSGRSSRSTHAAKALLVMASALILAGIVMVLCQCWSDLDHFDEPEKQQFDALSLFLGIPSAERLRDNLWYYTSGTHVAGINRTQAVYTRDYFRNQGISADIVEYYPWLNYPVDQRVALFNATTSEVLFEAGLKEDVIPGDPASSDPNNLPAFHGYSADGNVTGQLVYANYGSVDDFKALKAAGISVKDKIVLVRYGNLFRGLKVHGAELEGARGVLIYSDPAEDGYVQGSVYPEGPWRPESSFQRGSVQRMTVYPGDPLTPGYAATEDAPRLDPSKATNINHIPSLPLSHRDAEPLLRALKGQGKQASEVGDNWVGGLTSKGVEYWTGPSELNVNLLNKVEYKTMPIQNVIAKIPGQKHSEEAVIIGNHRDAWCAGASDPASGSAAMLEVARSFGELLKQGWQPRRTIILASWDAEEYFAVGSTEWGEDKSDWIRENVVAYLNLDGGVRGHNIQFKATPNLRPLIYDVTKRVKHPHSNKSVYDMWYERENSVQKTHRKSHKPHVGPLGSGSDYTVFLNHLGVSSVDFKFDGGSGVYHSNYDSFKWMTDFVDPDFSYHCAITQIWGALTITLADAPVLPFDVHEYAKDLHKYIDELKTRITSSSRINHTVAKRALRQLYKAADKLGTSARHIEAERRHLQKKYGERCSMIGHHRLTVCSDIRSSINSRLYKLERDFIDPMGLPGRKWYRHVLVSPGKWLGYGSQTLPALTEAVEEGDWKRFKALAKRTSEIINRAAWSLREA